MTPAREGHFWAKQHTADPRTADYGKEGFCLSDSWEVVQVFDNAENDWRAHVPGVEQSQPVEFFEWGPEVVHGEPTKAELVLALLKRADWLRSEYSKGGSREHLEPRETECRALADMLRRGRLP